MKDSRAGSNEYLVLQSSAGNMCVGTNQAMIADGASVTTACADDRVLHDDAIGSDADLSPALTDEAGSVQNAASRSDTHVTTYGGVGCYPSRGRYRWMFTGVSDQHIRVPPVA
jgi:hypothetical protein